VDISTTGGTSSGSFSKMEIISPSSGFVYAGMGADFRVLVEKARKQGSAYHRKFGENIPIRGLTQGIAQVMQEFTQEGGVRPFGVSLLVAGYDSVDGPQLFQADPSGAYFQWKATAIGKGMTSCKQLLERRWQPDMELEDAIHLALLCLRESSETQMTASTVQLGVIGEDQVFRILTQKQVEEYFQETL
jgi:20S proteasome subunit alpha 2